MFPAVDDELSKNPFFKGWKEKAVFARLLSPPPLLIEEFSKEWVEDFKKMTGDGPLTSEILGNLAAQIESLRKLEGYENIKRKLERLDDQLFPTLSEIEFIAFLLQNTPSKAVKLEKTFTTRSGKNPELRIDGKFGEVFIEVTSIQDFKEKSLILSYFNIFAAFQLSLIVLNGLCRELIIRFNKYPSKEIFDEIYGLLTKHMNMKKQDSSYPLIVNEKNENFSLSFSEGKKIDFEYPIDVIKNKIKDKIEDKTRQFDDGEQNFVVLDITSIVLNLGIVADVVKDYFEYSGNKTVCGVLLFSKRWNLEDFEPIFRIECLHQPNPLLDIDKTKAIVRDLLDKKL